jgi:hypothetical protein
MKRMPILIFGFAVLAAAAQSANAQDTMESQVSTRLGKAVSLSANEVKPNEIVKGKVAYGGIAVAAIKSDNLLQLFNPFAPKTYGSAEDNTLHDPGTSKARGWKLFSIHF